MVSHHIEEGCRERVQETLTDEHTAKIVLCCWALQFEYTSNSIQSVFDELGLFAVILVKEIDQNFEATTATRNEKGTEARTGMRRTI